MLLLLPVAALIYKDGQRLFIPSGIVSILIGMIVTGVFPVEVLERARRDLFNKKYKPRKLRKII